MDRNPTLAEFLAALDTVKRFVVLLEPLIGIPVYVDAASRPDTSTGSRPAQPSHRKRGGRPKGSVATWPGMIKTVLQSNGKPMARGEIVQKIADIKNVPPSDIAGTIGRTLHFMKTRGRLVHDKATGIYKLVRQVDQAPVVARQHADT